MEQQVSNKICQTKAISRRTGSLCPKRKPKVKVWSSWRGRWKLGIVGKWKQKEYLCWDGDGGSNYVGNESGQIVLLSLVRWVKPLPRPRFPRLSDNKWLPTLRLSVFCFLSNKTSQRAGKRETVEQEGKGERGPPWSAVICLTQSFRKGGGGQFGLFSPSPMNGCRQDISDGCDKISHPWCPAL